MTDRCEPPPELRDRAGWHWVRSPIGALILRFWGQNWNRWFGEMSDGWRYVAPVMTPDEVAAAIRARGP